MLASGVSRAASEATRTTGVCGHQHADPGTGRAWSGKILWAHWLGAGTGRLRKLWRSRGTGFAKLEPCTSCWIKRGGMGQWHHYATHGAGHARVQVHPGSCIGDTMPPCRGLIKAKAYLVSHLEAKWHFKWILPTTCSTKWPHELFGENLPNQKLGEVPILFDTSQYFWFARRKLFAAIDHVV